MSLYTIHSSVLYISNPFIPSLVVVVLWIGVVFWNRLVKLYRLMGTAKTKYQCFVNRFNSTGGLEPRNSEPSRHPEYQNFKKVDAILITSSSSLTV